MNLPGLGDLMKKAQQMQAEMERLLGERRVEGSAGGGMVTAVANGRGELIALRIDPEATSEDREMLQDLVVAAVNDALHKARNLMAEEVARLTGGLGLPPGLFSGGR